MNVARALHYPKRVSFNSRALGNNSSIEVRHEKARDRIRAILPYADALGATGFESVETTVTIRLTIFRGVRDTMDDMGDPSDG